MLSCWKINIFNNNYSITKDEIHMIRSDFEESVSCGSSFWENI